jgi:hypothetical protein
MNVNQVTIGGELISHEIVITGVFSRTVSALYRQTRPVLETHSPELEG